jgi:hypothetical protein
MLIPKTIYHLLLDSFLKKIIEERKIAGIKKRAFFGGSLK